jgi:hypothetical protein
MTDDTLFETERTEAAHPTRFRDTVRDELLSLGCSSVVRAKEGSTMLRVVEPDGRRAVWVTLARAEKNDKFGRGWTIEQTARDMHRKLETFGEPVMYALQNQGSVHVVPGDYLIEGITLATGAGGRSEHVLITDGRWPTLDSYLKWRG